MKPFTLHAVLKYRQQLEDTARQALYQALEFEARLQEALLRSEATLAELYQGLRHDQEQGTTVDRLLLFNHRIDLLREQVAAQQDKLEKQRQQVAGKRQQLVRASKNRKIMETMREQQNAAYRAHLARKELAQLDEIAVLSHGRRAQ